MRNLRNLRGESKPELDRHTTSSLNNSFDMTQLMSTLGSPPRQNRNTVETMDFTPSPIPAYRGSSSPCLRQRGGSMWNLASTGLRQRGLKLSPQRRHSVSSPINLTKVSASSVVSPEVSFHRRRESAGAILSSADDTADMSVDYYDNTFDKSESFVFSPDRRYSSIQNAKSASSCESDIFHHHKSEINNNADTKRNEIPVLPQVNPDEDMSSNEAFIDNGEQDHPEKIRIQGTGYCACLFKMCVVIAVFLVVAYISGLYLQSSQDGPAPETCNATTITVVASDFSRSAPLKIFGQDLAVEIVTNALGIFIKNPFRPLVLSLHGWSGVGKSHLADLIVNFLRPTSATTFIVPLEITQFVNIRNATENMLSYIHPCFVNIFIFEEMEEVTKGYMASVGAVIERVRRSKNTSVIFLLLSTNGARIINRVVLDHIKTGGKRHDISSEYLVASLLAGLEQDSVYSELFGLVDYWIPLMPLEKVHVLKCIERELLARKKSYHETVATDLAERLFYVPQEFPIFSKSGCKNIGTLVDIES
ncbi:torsin-like protein [Tubulanus polymorphus]|uniref:torsin-like protein n=1 Tax=Tubulanus polymorphus TaxID=672921 RepID=UPI003DA41FD4